MQAIKEPIPQPCKVIVFPKRMGTQTQSAPEPERNILRHNPTVHGSKAAIAAAIFACIAAIAAGGTCYVNWSNRSDQKTQRAKDQFKADVNTLIDAKLSPAVDKINAHIDEKFGELSNQIHALDVRIARLEGPLTSRVSELEKNSKQQAALAKLTDPDRASRALGIIQTELRTAQSSARLLPISDLDVYKNAVRALPQSAREYWTTIAEIINYQSFLNQKNGHAPDPARISRPCLGFTAGTGGGNLFVGGPITLRGCVVDLDSTHNAMTSAIIIDSVVRYHGGPVHVGSILFVNCAFELQLPPDKTPAQPAILYSLLNSADLRNVTINGM